MHWVNELVSKSVMIHPDTKTFSEKKDKAINFPQEVQVERNPFGYLVNVVLAVGWLLLFVTLSGTLTFGKKWDVFRIDERINFSSSLVLILASLLLGTFHSYVLHFDCFEKSKKESKDLIARILNSWPLVLGTVLYTVVVCIEIWKTYTYDYAAQEYFYPYRFNYCKIFGALTHLFVPMSICAIFLAKDPYWNIFNAWTIKTKDAKSAETDIVTEFRFVGFIVSVLLAIIWGVIACFAFSVVNDERTETYRQLITVATFCVIHICALVITGVHTYTLFNPKYDSGDAPNGFIKKNWLLVSSYIVASVTSITFIVFEWEFDHQEISFVLLSFFMVILICSCLVMIPSNSSKSWTRCFKPWNTEANTILMISV